MQLKFKILIFVSFAILIAGCSSQDNKNLESNLQLNVLAKYKNMTVDQLHEQLKSKDFVLIDTHIPEQTHINGTDAFIPFDVIENNLDKLPSDKTAKIVLYCRSGRMSEIAAEKLAKLGYTDVYNVIGGINEWNQRGYN